MVFKVWTCCQIHVLLYLDFFLKTEVDFKKWVKLIFNKAESNSSAVTHTAAVLHELKGPQVPTNEYMFFEPLQQVHPILGNPQCSDHCAEP